MPIEKNRAVNSHDGTRRDSASLTLFIQISLAIHTSPQRAAGDKLQCETTAERWGTMA